MPRTITLLNQKGGVGKTSTCFHLSATLARDGRSVLLVDNDPQASLTQGFFGPEGMRALPPASTVAAAYDPGADPDPGTVIRPTGVEGVSPVGRHKPRSAAARAIAAVADELLARVGRTGHDAGLGRDAA